MAYFWWSYILSHGLDGSGIKSCWRRNFPYTYKLALEPSRPLCRIIPEGKAAGTSCWPPIPSSTYVKERVELYIYSPSETSWTVLGRNLALTFMLKMFYTHFFAPQSWFVRNKLQQTQEGLYIWKDNVFSPFASSSFFDYSSLLQAS